jgi:uncharacterized protein (UPF0335 family)
MKTVKVGKKAARPSSTSTEGQLLQWSRKIARLEREQRELRRRLAGVRDELRFARRTLKAIAQTHVERSPMSPPFRVFGESQG